VSEQEDLKALERQGVILAVLAGRMSATQAAQELGVSRKTFYEWQDRALGAMRTALRDRPAGRPLHPVDPEKEQLKAAVETLEKERKVLESRLRIQQVVRETLDGLPTETSQPKKKGAV
jgi:transposase